MSVRFSFSWVLLEVPKHPWAYTLMWLSLRRTHKYINLPYNMKPFRKISSNHFLVDQGLIYHPILLETMSIPTG
jgi:hypothetical protein